MTQSEGKKNRTMGNRWSTQRKNSSYRHEYGLACIFFPCAVVTPPYDANRTDPSRIIAAAIIWHATDDERAAAADDAPVL
jgi:hypothetical protein